MTHARFLGGFVARAGRIARRATEHIRALPLARKGPNGRF
jgi:hypothetical protein